MEPEKFVEVDGQKFVDDGAGSPKLDDSGNRVPFVEQTVPYHRFKEVNDKFNDLSNEIKALKEQKGDKGLTPEQEKELQAKTYLKTLLKETLTEEEKAKKDAEKRELETFQREVDDVLASNTDVKRTEFTKFLEKEGDDYSSVASAFKGFQRLKEAEKEGADKANKDKQRKKDAALPGSEGTGEGVATFANPPKEDTGKSLWQIAQDALRGRK